MFALFPAAMRPHSEPYKFLLHILSNNSAAENCTDVRLGQVVNLSIFYNIRNYSLQTFHGLILVFDSDSENLARVASGSARVRRENYNSIDWKRLLRRLVKTTRRRRTACCRNHWLFLHLACSRLRDNGEKWFSKKYVRKPQRFGS